jgi:hypothetical protein
MFLSSCNQGLEPIGFFGCGFGFGYSINFLKVSVSVFLKE